MNTRWERLKGMTREQQVKALAGAADFLLKQPVLAVEALGVHALANVNMPGAKMPGATIERFKSHLRMKYATPDDNDELTDVANQMEQFFHSNMPELDMGFAQLFKMVDLRGSTHDHFDILDTNAAITFNQRKPGEKVEIRKAISESKTTVNYLEFADGLGLLDQWLQFNQFWNIDEALAEFRAKYFDKMASYHYALFVALGAGINIAFDTDDVKTANKAAATILRNMRDQGTGMVSNANLFALTSPEYEGRLQKMLMATRGSSIVEQGTVGQPLTARISGIVSTTHISASDAANGWYLVLPGRKIQRGVWMDPTVEDDRNIYVSATDLVARGQYNAAIGDSNQVARCAWS